MSRKKCLKPIGFTGLIIFLFVFPVIINSPYWIHILILCGINIILASSLRLIHTTGQLSIAHGGMMCVGAYTSTLLVMSLGVSSWLALLASGVSAAIIACIVGWPFMRLKGVYFAMATVFLGQVILLVMQQWQSLTKGSMGIINIPGPDPIVIPGLLNIDFSSKVDYYYFMLVLVLITFLVLYAIEHSRVGLAFSALSHNESLAESVGMGTNQYKIIAFCTGCFFAGISGGFYAQYIHAIVPETFGFFYAIYVIVYMVVGGTGSIFGPVIGATILTFFPEFLRDLGKYQPFAFAAFLMLVIFFLPDGLVSLPQRLRKYLHRKG